MSLLSKFLTVVFFLCTAGFAQEPITKELLLKKMILAYGGEESLKNASKYTQKWKVARASDLKEGTEVRYVNLPKNLVVELKYPDRSEKRVLKNGIGYKIFNEKNKKEVKGPMLDAMKAQLLRLYNPYQLSQNLGKLKLSNKNGYYMLTLKEGNIECYYYVNKNSYFIEKSIGKFSILDLSMEFITLYSDFVRVGEVVFPSKEIKYAGGINTATNTLLKTDIISTKTINENSYKEAI